MWQTALAARDAALQGWSEEQLLSHAAASSPVGASWGLSAGAGPQQQQLLGAAEAELLLPGGSIIDSKSADAAATWVEPRPHYVMKAKLQDGQKLFINLCGHEAIEPWHFKELLEEERAAAGLQQQHGQGIRVPLSIGPCQLPTQQTANSQLVEETRTAHTATAS